MKCELCQPFIQSLNDTFSTMLACEAQHKESLRIESKPEFLDVSGVISFSGGANGVCVLSLSREVALKAASAILMCDATELDADVTDAVGELTNIVAGGAKSKLEHLRICIGLPTVITGAHHEVKFPSQVQPISMEFASEWGPVMLTVGLLPVAELALA